MKKIYFILLLWVVLYMGIAIIMGKLDMEEWSYPMRVIYLSNGIVGTMLLYFMLPND